MRTVLKSITERVLCGVGVTRAVRRRRAGETLVLAYHNVVPDGEPYRGDLSLHLSQRAFARQLDLLRRTHEVVPLAALLDGEPPVGAKPRAVITFDDAYRGAVTAGVDELVRRDLPATICVAPAFLGGASFWWDVLAGPDGLAEEVRLHGLQALQGKDAAIRGWAAERGLASNAVPAHQTAATLEQLDAAAGSPGITLASHTWSHVNLAAVRGAELDEELARPLAWLRERYPNALRWITYPYGLSSPTVEEAARRAGYLGGLRVEGGWMPRSEARPASWRLPRLNVPAGISISGFELRVSGVLTR